MSVHNAPLCYVNGKKRTLPPDSGDTTLLQFLRGLNLKGVKHGCGEAVCGACTVSVSYCRDGRLHHRAINACICPLYTVDGMHVITAEGIGSSKKGLHPIQARLANANGSQCGFCTPGFVMAMYAKLRSTGGRLSEAELQETLSGNLCRCTGYRPIVDAFRGFCNVPEGRQGCKEHATIEDVPAKAYTADAVSHMQNGVSPDGPGSDSDTTTDAAENVCPSTGMPCSCRNTSGRTVTSRTKGAQDLAEADRVQQGSDDDEGRMVKSEPIFPPTLRSWQPTELCMPGRCTWYRPVTLERLLELKRAHPKARLVGGHNELGIQVKYGAAPPKALISITHIPEMRHMQASETGVTVGAAVTMSDLRNFCAAVTQQQPQHRTRVLRSLGERISRFGGNQLCNAATVGGNVATASSISDINALFMAAGAVYKVVGRGAEPRSVLPEDFITGPRQTSMQADEVLTDVFIPFTQHWEWVAEFKQSHKRDEQLAVGNAGFRMLLAKPASPGGTWQIEDARIALSGAVPYTQLAPKAALALAGQPFSQATLAAAQQALSQDLAAASDSSGWRASMQRTAIASFLLRFFLQVSQQLPGTCATLFPDSFQSGAWGLQKPVLCKSVQHYPLPADENAIVGQPYVHMAAHVQVTGEAQYVGDIKLAGMLHAAVVTSAHAHARLLSVDAAAAEQMEGVQGVFHAFEAGNATPGTGSAPPENLYNNSVGHMRQDEEVFASHEVHTVGQVIALVVAETEPQARAAARAVRVEYEPLDSIVSIDDALAAGSFLDEGESEGAAKGDTAAAWKLPGLQVREGTVRIGAQEHFYLEPHVAVIEPGEDDELAVHVSTQSLSAYHGDLAKCLKLPAHKVAIHTKRVGGGFGGKETRFITTAAGAAVAARKLQAPVRICLDRHEDMQITGHRHPFLVKYKVGFTAEGRIQALEMEMYLNGGWSLDISTLVLGKGLLHADNVYNIPNMRVRGRVCRTNTASNTAMRGLGGPQAMLAMETVMERVATETGSRQEAVRSLNMYRQGDKAPFGQPLEGAKIQACWQRVMQQSGFETRREAALAHNRQHRFIKRGICLIPVKFGVGFTGKFVNQAGALVHIYTDGTVLVTHGGVELGQGLHTKCAMVAAQELGIPLSAVHIKETATDKVPNQSPTAASASSDLYCAAVMDACRQLSTRLAPFRKGKQNGKENKPSFGDAVRVAYMQRVDLCAHGFHATPLITGSPGEMPVKYFTYGAACSEIELDCLTGNFSALRTDIVMDVGHSLNPALDIGQIEGAFVQGYGMTCCEELVWGDAQHSWLPRGRLQTQGPGSYKIPGASDIPLDLRVTLLDPTVGQDASFQPQNLVHSSKSTGEPPLFLGSAIFFAIKQAVYAAREEHGVKGFFQLDSPLSSERLRMACHDDLCGGAGIPAISC